MRALCVQGGPYRGQPGKTHAVVDGVQVCTGEKRSLALAYVATITCKKCLANMPKDAA